jgi:hypothetical protein
MGLAYLLVQNNPRKLLELYNSVKVQSEKDKIVHRLCKLKAGNELWTLKEYLNNDEVVNVLIEINRLNTEKLTILYSQTRNQNTKITILNRIVEINEETAFWNILELYEEISIVNALLKLISSNPGKLEQLFFKLKSEDLKCTIVDHLCEIKAENQLWRILESKYYINALKLLIEINSLNPEKLLLLYYKSESGELSSAIVNKMVDLHAESELLDMIKFNQDSFAIIGLIKLFGTYPKKLGLLYKQVKSNEFRTDILKRLCEFQADDQLWNILKYNKNAEVVQILIDINSSNPEKLLLLYSKTKVTQLSLTIVNKLVDLHAEGELWDIIKSNQDTLAIRGLLKLSGSNPKKLELLYKHIKSNELRTDILNMLCELHAEDKLWHILEYDINDKIVQILISMNNSNPEKLLLLYSMTNDSNLFAMIESSLLKLKASKELWEVIKIKRDETIISYLVELNVSQPIELEKLYNISSNQKTKDFILWKMSKLIDMTEYWKTVNPLKLALLMSGEDNSSEFVSRWSWLFSMLNDQTVFEYFFSYCNNVQRYYLLQSHLNNVFEIGIQRSQLDSKLTKKYFTKNVTKLGQIIKQIKSEYVEQKKSAQNRRELEEIIAYEEHTTLKLMDSNSLNNSNKEQEESVNTGFVSSNETINHISIMDIDNDAIISFDDNNLKRTIQSELDEVLAKLNDPDSIMKAKSLAVEKENNVFNPIAVVNSLLKIKPDSICLDKLKVIFDKLLLLPNDTVKKAIISYIAKSKDVFWSQYILQNRSLLKFESLIVGAISKKYCVEQLQIFILLTKIMFSHTNLQINNSRSVSTQIKEENISSNSFPSWLYLGSVKNAREFSPDSLWLATDDGVYSTTNWELVANVKFGKCFSLESRWLGTDDGVYLTANWERVANLKSCRFFSPDSKWLATDDGVYSTTNWERVANLKSCRFFSPDSKWLATNDGLHKVNNWNVIVSKGNEFERFGGNVNCFSPDGKWLSVGTCIYSTSNWHKVENAYGDKFSPDSRWAITQHSIFSTIDWCETAQIYGGLCFSPDGKWLVSRDGIYSTENWKILCNLDVIKSENTSFTDFISFSYDGKWLVTRFGIYSTKNWSEAVHIITDSWKYRFSPDGKWFIDSEGNIYLIQIPSLSIQSLLNSFVYLRCNTNTIDIVDLMRVKMDLNEHPLKKQLIPCLDELISIVAKASDAVCLEKSNKVDSTDISLQEIK